MTHLCSDPTSCQSLPDVGKHVTSTLAVASARGCARSGLAVIEVAAEPVGAAGAACSRTQGLD
jgi:hypothetical protein